ncbi:MAG: hypothetical protein JNL74_03770 [Fibrobacteres bacterium]|nr:hypothetical protein [Fibrobacterota bacterium]
MKSKYGFSENGRRCTIIHSNKSLVCADGYLHNDTLYFQADQSGKVTAHFNQPEHTKYSGNFRCFYIRDDVSGKFWSVQNHEFSVGLDDLRWSRMDNGIDTSLNVFIPREDNVECWNTKVRNCSSKIRRLSIFSCFPIGSPSPAYQRGEFNPKLNGIVLSHFPGHSDADEYYELRKKNNLTFCLADKKPMSTECNEQIFIGHGGYSSPEALYKPKLSDLPCYMDSCTAVMQFSLTIKPGHCTQIKFLFGPAINISQISKIRKKYFSPTGFTRAFDKVEAFRKEHESTITVETPDIDFNHFINHWLPKQTIYCGYNQRMSLAPCVRNCLQDAMGLVYTAPEKARELFLKTFAEQNSDGSLWMSVMLAPLKLDAGFAAKHRDKNVWAPFALHYYLTETGDWSLLKEKVTFKDKSKLSASIFDHVCLGLDWLIQDRSKRGLNLLGEGDWCDPLNMAGIGMKGESVWLSQAVVHALTTWADVADWVEQKSIAQRYRREAEKLKSRINRFAWDGKWYAAGFKDDGKAFGIKQEREGKVWLNAQSWALISGIATGEREKKTVESVSKYLQTSYGPAVLAPAYTSMREDIGRVTIKVPGTNENGSVYCHAASFYAYALFILRRTDDAFKTLRALLPTDNENQLPLYIPNMFRGPAAGWTVGRSSHYPGTGTAAWFYRLAIDRLFGVRADFDTLIIDPQLPSCWTSASISRIFRGALYDVHIRRSKSVNKLKVILNGKCISDRRIPMQPLGTRHKIEAIIPMRNN